MDLPDEDEVMNNPNVWSKTVAVGQKSFVDDRQSYNKLAPPPKYHTSEELLQDFKLPTDKDEIFFGMENPEDVGGLICRDEDMLNKQKGVLTHVVKQIAVNVLKGLSLSHISMPIKIFEPKSSIQRMCDLWSGSSKYLQ